MGQANQMLLTNRADAAGRCKPFSLPPSLHFTQDFPDDSDFWRYIAESAIDFAILLSDRMR